MVPRARRISRNPALVWVVTIVTVAGVIWFLWSEWDQLAPLVEVPIGQTLVVGVLFAVGMLLNALEFWVLYRRLGADIGIVENWLLFGAGQLLNHAPGQGGTVYRFSYLKAVHGLPYARSASGYGANLVLTVLATGMLGLAGTLTVGLSEGTSSVVLTTTFAVLSILAIGALFFSLPTTDREGRLARAWRGFHEGWVEVTADRSTAVYVLLLEFTKYFVLALRMQIALSWIGVDERFAFFLVLAAVTGLVTFVAITPAGLGLRELAIGFTGAALGVDFDLALLGATLDRAVMLVWVCLVGGAGLFYTSRRMVSMRSGPTVS